MLKEGFQPIRNPDKTRTMNFEHFGWSNILISNFCFEQYFSHVRIGINLACSVEKIKDAEPTAVDTLNRVLELQDVEIFENSHDYLNTSFYLKNN